MKNNSIRLKGDPIKGNTKHFRADREGRKRHIQHITDKFGDIVKTIVHIQYR